MATNFDDLDQEQRNWIIGFVLRMEVWGEFLHIFLRIVFKANSMDAMHAIVFSDVELNVA